MWPLTNSRGKPTACGFDVDARKEFNRLISDLGVDVADESAAIRVADLYRHLRDPSGVLQSPSISTEELP